MSRSEWLQHDQRNMRRTIADAIDVLRSKVVFDGARTAEIRVGGLRLPSNDIVGLVCVSVESPADDTTFIVSLPTSKQFRAKRQGSAELETFDISQLDGATIDYRGVVELRDGMLLRAVDVKPALLSDATELDWRIVHHTIAFMGAEQQCYGSPMIWFVPPRLDCSRLSALQASIPLLKQIQGYIADVEPALKHLSEQKIADALCKFGVRLPRPRRN
jgi:hypothetical protein